MSKSSGTKNKKNLNAGEGSVGNPILKSNRFVYLVGAVIVLGLALAILSSNYISGSLSQQPQPYFPNTGQAIPSNLSTVLSQSDFSATANLSALTERTLANASNFGIEYAGTLNVRPTSSLGAFASINSPLFITESRQGQNINFNMNVTSVPLLGHADAIYIAQNGKYQSCSNINYAAAEQGNYAGVLFGGNNQQCVPSSTISGVNMASLANFDLSTLQDYGININYTVKYQSIYNGVQCTFVAGTLTQPGAASGSGNFQMCISDKYYVPLTMSIYFANKYGQFAVAMNETQIG